MRLVSVYRIGVFPGEEVVLGTLDAAFSPDHPEVQQALAEWEGPAYLDNVDGEHLLTLVRTTQEPTRPRWWLHALLLSLTVLTTHMAGALMLGVDPFQTVLIDVWGVPIPLPTGIDLGALALGAPFSLALITILVAHESGHYFAARRHGVRVTPPFFIPVPAYFSIIGTLGAFIRIRGPMVRRAILFDIGIAGPIMSFCLSLPAFLWGLSKSSVLSEATSSATPFRVQFYGELFSIGGGLLTQLSAHFILQPVEGAQIVLLHPVAFAGWLGLFVTCLNLLPLGQLDGGHILYAMVPRMQRLLGALFVISLIPLGRLWWGWWLWGGVAIALSRARIGHPPVLREEVPLDRSRIALGVAAVIVFFLTFIPIPVVL